MFWHFPAAFFVDDLLYIAFLWYNFIFWFLFDEFHSLTLTFSSVKCYIFFGQQHHTKACGTHLSIFSCAKVLQPVWLNFFAHFYSEGTHGGEYFSGKSLLFPPSIAQLLSTLLTLAPLSLFHTNSCEQRLLIISHLGQGKKRNAHILDFAPNRPVVLPRLSAGKIL